MDKNLICLRQNRAAQKIKDLLIKISNENRLPETYHPDDFQIGFAHKKGKKNILRTKGWRLEEIISIHSDYDQPPHFDHKTIGKFQNAEAIIRMILVNDVARVVDAALYFIAQNEEAQAIGEAWKNVLS